MVVRGRHRQRAPRSVVISVLAAALVGLLAWAVACTGGSSSPPTARTGGSATAPGAPAASRSGGSPKTGTGPDRVANKVMLGSYIGLSGKNQKQSAALRKEQLGRDQRIVHLYFRWEDDLPDTDLSLSPGSVLLLSWRGTAYDQINNGSQDAHIVASAKRVAKYGKPVLLRWGWEMNGDWFAWTGAQNRQDTAGYVAAWRRIHQIFADQGVTNVSWVWVANWNNHPDASWNTPAKYYPGDEYVDWVGVDGFNTTGESVDSLFGQVYDEFAGRKPFMIAETGALEGQGRGKAVWISELEKWIKGHRAVGALVWFDTDTNTDAGVFQNWRVDSSPEALEAYQALAKDPYFSG
jgi:hypothetical protein